MAQRITSTSTCKQLGLSLGLEGHEIDSVLHDHRHEIISAVNSMLTNWQRRYEDRKVACGVLIPALRKCGLQGLIPEVFAEEYRMFQKQEVPPLPEPVPETYPVPSTTSAKTVSRPIYPDIDVDDLV